MDRLNHGSLASHVVVLEGHGVYGIYKNADTGGFEEAPLRRNQVYLSSDGSRYVVSDRWSNPHGACLSERPFVYLRPGERWYFDHNPRGCEPQQSSASLTELTCTLDKDPPHPAETTKIVVMQRDDGVGGFMEGGGYAYACGSRRVEQITKVKTGPYVPTYPVMSTHSILYFTDWNVDVRGRYSAPSSNRVKRTTYPVREFELKYCINSLGDAILDYKLLSKSDNFDFDGTRITIVNVSPLVYYGLVVQDYLLCGFDLIG